MESRTTRAFLERESELVWLGFLLTGDISLSREAAGEARDARDPNGQFFEQQMSAWRRRLVIAKALDTVRLPLAASACRVRLNVQNSTYGDQLPSPAWSAGREVSRAQFEDALLAIDILLRIPAKSNSIPEGSRTPFRAEAEQDSGMIPNTNRSVATLAF